MKITLSAIAVSTLLFVSSVNAQTIPENDKTTLKLFFSAATPTEPEVYVPPIPELTLLSSRVTAPNSCKGNIGLSITNAFTDGTIKKIFENFDGIVKGLATPSGMIFLGSLYVSKTNPNLYALVTKGFDLGINDYLSAMGSCEAMAEALVDIAADPVIDMQRKTKLNAFIEKNAETALDEEWNDWKVEDIVRGGMDELAEAGVDIFGQRRAGKNQPALDVIQDTLKYGWCIYRGFSKDECIKYYGENKSDLPRLSEAQEVIFESPEALNRTGLIILGNRYISICQGCETIETQGTGVNSWVTMEQNKIFAYINQLSQLPLEDITDKQYKLVGFPPSIIVDANYFRNLALLENDYEVRNLFAMGWAYDVAYQRAIVAMDALENSLNALQTSTDVENAGIRKEVEMQLQTLKDEREKLERTMSRNNYVPKMYVRSLLHVGPRLADGKSPLGEWGDSL